MRLETEQAEKLLADTGSRKLDEAHLDKNSLQAKKAVLTSWLQKLARRLENLQIEKADAEDHDAPHTKDSGFEIAQRITALQKELGEKSLSAIKTQEELDALETRIQSIEALFPGETQNN